MKAGVLCPAQARQSVGPSSTEHGSPDLFRRAPEPIRSTISSQLEHIRSLVGTARYDAGRFPLVAQLFEEMMHSSDLREFLTLAAAYDHID